ncbi:MAG: dTMP kinase [Pseudomonadota bacterium]
MEENEGARRGLFITFEGGDGVGKSTQVQRLADALKGRGRSVVATREPGGAPGAEAIRELLVTGAADRWTPMAEALMMYAARAEHLEKTIKPALERGDIVLCDRFIDSTMAYQGYAGALGKANVAALRALVVPNHLLPDVTFVLSAEKGAGIERARARNDLESRFEDKGADYQTRVENAFLDIARDNPERCVVIDANQTIDAVAAAILDALAAKFPEIGEGRGA